MFALAVGFDVGGNSTKLKDGDVLIVVRGFMDIAIRDAFNNAFS